MALMAVLRVSSRVKASRSDFWMKKRMVNNDMETMMIRNSITVKPDLDFM